MDYDHLGKDLISDTRHWRMALRLGRESLHVILFSPVEENSLIYRRLPLDANASTPLAAIEEAVYDNPLLLGDFDRIYCIVDTSRGFAIPSLPVTDDDMDDIMATAFPDFDGPVIANDINARNARILFGIDRDVEGFLRRTFFNVSIFHHLTPLCRYFLGKHNRGNSRRMYANLRHDALDLIAIDKGNLLMANTFSFREPIDAVYYILASQQSLGIDPTTNELMLSGDQTIREAITPTLREYIGYVMPVIFPSSMFKAGKDSMKAPFDLTVIPLCE